MEKETAEKPVDKLINILVGAVKSSCESRNVNKDKIRSVVVRTNIKAVYNDLVLNSGQRRVREIFPNIDNFTVYQNKSKPVSTKRGPIFVKNADESEWIYLNYH